VSIPARAMREKRAVLRHPTNFSCQFTFEGIIHDANMMNLSLDGAFLWSPFVPPKGSRVVVTLRTPLSEDILTTESEVVRTECASENGVDAFAVRFCNSSELSKKLVSQPFRGRVQQILFRKATLIFEELGFLLPYAETVDTRQKFSRRATVSFYGPFCGRLVVSFTAGILTLLPENMLGGNGFISTSLNRDALGEIANLICESLLPEISTEDFFYLDTPTVSKGHGPHGTGSDLIAAVQVHFGAHSGCVEIAVFIST
jgi:CheY-specific phosphatase CheX